MICILSICEVCLIQVSVIWSSNIKEKSEMGIPTEY